MQIILSYHAFLVWLNFQLDKSELGERKREVIPTAPKALLPQTASLVRVKLAWRLVCFLPDICACVYHIQK
jgi:hypothetical protein